MKSFVIFEILEQSYGIDIELVKRILPFQELTEIPDEPDIVQGMFQYEDDVIKVYSFRKMIGLDTLEKDIKEQRCLILVGKDGKNFGMYIDNIDDIMHVKQDSLHLPKQEQSLGEHMNVEAILEDNGKLITLVKDIN